MLGLVCFMCPGLFVVLFTNAHSCTAGLFNTLSGIGGGGQIDETTGANANVALYSTFSVGCHRYRKDYISAHFASSGNGFFCRVRCL